MSSAKEIIQIFNDSPKKGLDKILSHPEYVGKEAADQFLAAEGAYNLRKKYMKFAEEIASARKDERIVEKSKEMDEMEKTLGISFEQRLAYQKAFRDVQYADPKESKEAQQKLEAAERSIIGDTKEKLGEVRQALINAKSFEIAAFLCKNNKQLNPSPPFEVNLHALGEFLGEPSNNLVLGELAKQMNFAGKEFDHALREYMNSFRMPGEAQKIERIMEAFGESYSQGNPMGKDAAFVLAFSTIMLNTDLHNESNKKKMTKEEFVKNNRGIDHGQDLPKEFLEKIYDSVAQKEIRSDVSRTVPGFTVSGSLKSKDKIFDQMNSLFGKSDKKTNDKGEKTFDVTKTMKSIFPYENIKEAKVNKPKSYLKRLIGYEGQITLKTFEDKEVTMQFYQPSFFSRSKTPRLVIQPDHENMHPKANSLELAASVASKFEHSILKIDATYNYSKDAINKSYETAKKEKPLDLEVSKTKTWIEKIKSKLGLEKKSSKSQTLS